MDKIRNVGDGQDIEMSFKEGIITIEGGGEEVDKAKDAIHELLRIFHRERWSDEEAKLVADTVQWSIMVCVPPPPPPPPNPKPFFFGFLSKQKYFFFFFGGVFLKKIFFL